MTEKPENQLKQFIYAFSRAMDLVDRSLGQHHRRVTVIAMKLAARLNLAPQEQKTLFYAGLLHDIGVTNSREKQELAGFDYENTGAHCELGYEMTARLELFSEIAVTIRYHHDRWQGRNKSGLSQESIPLLSQIIHLADRTEVLIQNDKYILSQSPLIIERISKLSGPWFNPRLVEPLQELAGHEVFWLDLTSEFMGDVLEILAPADGREITPDNLIELGYLFARVIDYKNPFAKSHSVRVAKLALKIGNALGWRQGQLKSLLLAGLLHDLGKLSIPNEILDKPAALTPEEYSIIKMHPYYTYRLLRSIPGFEEIALWAGLHHGQIDGTGYPFGLFPGQLPEGARIIAIADRFTALTEGRAYLPKQPIDLALEMLKQDVKRGLIDGEILKIMEKLGPSAITE